MKNESIKRRKIDMEENLYFDSIKCNLTTIIIVIII